MHHDSRQLFTETMRFKQWFKKWFLLS